MKRIISLGLGVSLAFTITGCDYLQIENNMEQNQGTTGQAPQQNNQNQLENNQGNNGVVSEKDNYGEEQPNNRLTLEAGFFNEVREVDGKKVIQNPDNILVLVNKQFSLPSSYEPENLVRPKVNFSFGSEDIEKSYMRKEAAKALEKMFSDAKKEANLDLFAVSGYRSFKRQQEVFNAQVASVGEKKAIQVVAFPGQSEHQTGLTMDISSQSADFLLEESFEKTAEGKWLRENAHRYGFIMRYPKGKEAITGYDYEPWHFRYVGKEAATIIYEEGWTLEEYFDIVEKV